MCESFSIKQSGIKLKYVGLYGYFLCQNRYEKRFDSSPTSISLHIFGLVKEITWSNVNLHDNQL
jgi:hypothetical protein